jgi:hypothetical protein
MLVACRLAGLSALETCYALVRVGAQFGAAWLLAQQSRIANRPLPLIRTAATQATARAASFAASGAMVRALWSGRRGTLVQASPSECIPWHLRTRL